MPGDSRGRGTKNGAAAARLLRERARRAVQGSGPPTQPIALPRLSSGLSADVERSVLDLVLRAGDALVATGAPVAEVTAALLKLADGFGVRALQIDITFISITASIDREDEPITGMRVIAVRTSDYSRLADLYALVDDAAAGHMDLAEAHRRLTRIVEAPHPYRRWIVTLALAAMAAGVAVLLNGGWPVALAAGVTTGIIDRTLRRLRAFGLPSFFQQVAGAAIATTVALVLLWGHDQFDWESSLLPPSLIVASGIVVLLAGLSLVGAAEDAISGYPLTAAARSFEVALHTIGLVVGIGVTLDIGRRLGAPLRITDPSTLSTPAVLQILAGAIIAGAWAVASYARPRTVIPVAVSGASAVGVYVALSAAGAGSATGAFGAALVVGFASGFAADRLGVQQHVVSVSGITPLLPGLAIYRAMFTLVDTNGIVEGGAMLLAALAIGLALAAGVTLGEFLATPLRKMDRWQRRVGYRARGARN